MKLDGTKSKVPGKRDWFPPELEIEPIGAGSQNSWHLSILPNCDSFRTGIHYGS